MGHLMEDTYKAFRENRLELDDKFTFGCKKCGNCCRNRDSDILMSPYDVFQIARYLNLRTGDVVTKYGDCYIGPDSKLPLLAIKPRVYDRSCPFLSRKTGCRIHAVKPAACALFPLGRGINPLDNTLHYFLNSDSCGTREQQHTVRDWISTFHLDESEAFFVEWTKVSMDFSPRFCKIQKVKHLKEQEDKLYFNFTGILYVLYSLDTDFMPQFRENLNTLDTYLKSLGI